MYWKHEQDNCYFLLHDSKWKFAIKEGGKTRRFSKIINNMLIIKKKKEFSYPIFKEFSINYIGSKLSNLKVCFENGVKGFLGISEAIIVTEIVVSIINAHPDNKGHFWLFNNTLKCLVCLVLAVRSRFCINKEGYISRIADNIEIISLKKKFAEKKSFILSTRLETFFLEENKHIKERKRSIKFFRFP